MIKKITFSLAMFLLCLTVNAQLTIQVNGGAAQTGTSLENAITNAGVALGSITQLEVTAGDFITADWEYVKSNNGLDDNNQPITTGFTALTTFTIADGITSVADMTDAIFRGNTVITTVSIAKVTSTGLATFLNCSALTTVSFPEATSIEDVVFRTCENLTTANIPLATSIGYAAFEECRDLTEANFPLVTTIGDRAFGFCDVLTEANFPLVTSIGDNAFQFSVALTTASFPHATSIGNSAFKSCSALATLQLGATPPTVGGTDVFTDTPTTRNLVIVDAMGDPLMPGSDYDTAKAAYDPDGDGKWYGWTIADAPALRIQVNGGAPQTGTSLENAIANAGVALGSTTQLEVNAGDFKTTDWVYLRDNRNNLSALATFTITDGINTVADIPNTTSGIPYFNTTSIITVSVAKVASIGDYAFYACSSLTSVSFPQATSVGDNTFESCSSLTSVSFPQATSIGNAAFEVCSGLTSVSFPQATSIGSYAFYNCSDLATLQLGTTPPTVGVTDAFGGSSVPDPRNLVLVDAMGNPLTAGQTYDDAKAAYDPDNDGLWYGWTIAPAASCITLSLAQTNVSTPGGNDGSLTVTATDGTAPYIYTWSNGATTANITGLSANTYTVTVTDNTACTNSASATITEPIPLQFTTQPSTAAQSVPQNGTATALSVAVTGGQSPYSYQWYSNTTASNTGGTAIAGATSASYTPSTATAGTTYYYAVVTDSDNTSITSDVSGAITVTAIPYAKALDFDGTDDRVSIPNNSANNITGTQITLEAKIKVDQFRPNAYQGGIIVKEGAQTGYMIRAGGNGVVNFNLGSGSWNELNTGNNTLTTGQWYHIAATYDGATQKIYVNGQLVASQSMSFSIAATSNALGIGNWTAGGPDRGFNGIIDEVRIWDVARTAAQINQFKNNELPTSEQNGNLKVYYKLNQGIANADNSSVNQLYNEKSGTNEGSLENFTLNGTTSNWVIDTDVDAAIPVFEYVTQPSTSTQSVPQNDPATALSVAVTGGVSPYSYQWYSNTTASNTGGTAIAGATSASYTPSTATVGTTYYYAVVTDSNNTSITSDVSGAITVTSCMTLSIAQTNVSTPSGNDGSLTVTATDGTAPYIYTWSNGATTAAITGLSANTYTVTVTDAAAPPCVATASATITEPIPLQFTTQPSTAAQSVPQNGTATALSVVVTGGESPYSYQWYSNSMASNTGGTVIAGATSASYIPSTSTVGTTYYYAVVADDDNISITSDASGAITVTSCMTLSIAQTNVSTPGGNDGSLTVTPTGGTTPYIYTWSNGATTAAITGLSANTYTVTVTDNTACTNSATATITEPAPCDQGYSNNRIYVNASATGAADGKAWTTAYTDLQDAIDKAVSCSDLTEIWVAAGTYKPSKKTRDSDRGTPITTSDDRDVSFHLIDGVKIYGGFAGTEAALADRDLSTNTTTLSGDIGTTNDNGDNTYHVVISVSDTDATILDGFTITGGNANDSGDIYVESKIINRSAGGGMYNNSSLPSISNTTFSGNTASTYGVNDEGEGDGGGMYNNSSSLSISNTTFSGNTASSQGGGIYNTSSSPNISNTTFSGNTSYEGGGIYNTSSSPSISNTTFSGNTTSGDGGGMNNSSSSSPSISNVTFIENTASSGGGMYNSSSSPSISNVTFIENTASSGGGMHNYNSSTSITNVTFSGNMASYNGGGMRNSFTSPKIYNSIFWGNKQGGLVLAGGADISNNSSAPTVENCLTQIYGTNGENGNKVGQAPLFVDAANPAGADGIFGTTDDGLSLQSGSPAIDAGNNTPPGVTMPTTDITGATRQQSVAVDMGPYESICDLGFSNNRIYVNASATGTIDGKTWSTAYTNLQDALDKAATCSSLTEIWVSQGTYMPSKNPRTNDTGADLITSSDPRDVTFHLIDGVKLYGGFAGTEANLSDRDITAHETILSGDIGTVGDNTDNAYHVVISVSDSDATIFDGFTITDSNANGSDDNMIETKYIYRASGGGMFNSYSSPSITNVTFSTNMASYNGGGMRNDDSSPSITNVTFSTNTASSGGGMYNNDSSPSIMNVTFSTNAASSYGGGMLNKYSSSPIIANVTFSGNTASNGGGISNNDSSPSITNATFIENTASSKGGGMFNTQSSSPIITNVTFIGNAASSNGGGIYSRNSSLPKIYNSIFWNNKKGGDSATAGADIDHSSNNIPTIEHSLTQENSLYNSGTGIINNQDPLFVDAANPAGADGIFGTADDGLRLQCASPAINVGNNAPTGVTMPGTDITGAIRIQGGTVDMGAYEGGETTSPASALANTSLPTEEGVYASNYAFEEGGMKHYCTCDNKLLLSIGTNSNVPDNGVSLKIGDTQVSHYAQGTGFINNPNGASLMNRTWNATPTTQPSSDVIVRYYFTASDYTAINTSLTDNGGTALTEVEQMKFYKATKPGAHLPIADIASNEVIVLDNGNAPSTSVWQVGSLGSNHYAEFKVSSFSGGGGGASSAGQAILPVEMIYFTAKTVGNDVRLDWATANEVNNAGFDIERSADGRNFATIGYVHGSGTTTQEMTYYYIDTNPIQGVSYYRLKQIDYDGGYAHTDIISVRIDGETVYSIYPNPTADVLYISKPSNYSIVNSHGQVVLSDTGNSIDVSALPGGLYLIQFENGRTARFVKK